VFEREGDHVDYPTKNDSKKGKEGPVLSSRSKKGMYESPQNGSSLND
jgi:hypothetical protein